IGAASGTHNGAPLVGLKGSSLGGEAKKNNERESSRPLGTWKFDEQLVVFVHRVRLSTLHRAGTKPVTRSTQVTRHHDSGKQYADTIEPYAARPHFASRRAN